MINENLFQPIVYTLGMKAPVAEYKMSTQPRDKSLEFTFNAQCTFVWHFFIEKYLFIALSNNVLFEKTTLPLNV